MKYSMNYREFKKKTAGTLIVDIFKHLGILQEKRVFFEIDTSPDYDLTEYQQTNLANYIFQNSWDFSDEFELLLEFDFYKSYIFHSENIENIIRECEFDYMDEWLPFSEIVTKAHGINPEMVIENSFPSNYEYFNLKELRVIGIDNINKEVNYQGSVWADSYSLDKIDFELLTNTKIIGVTKGLEIQQFHLQLLCESFILMSEKRHKLAFFTAYSALENFTNTIMNSHEIADRFEDKLKEVFKTSDPVLNTTQIYTSIIGEFGSYTSKRNTIAHGRQAIDIGKTEVEEIIRFASILIALYTWKDSDFDSLYTRIHR